MSFQLIIHADDFGLTRQVTQGIIKGCNAGVISSVSIIPNGAAFEYAIEELKKRPYLKCAVHLNLVEGCPVSDERFWLDVTDFQNGNH